MLTRREALVASGAAGIIAATAGTATAQSTFKLPEKFSPREVRVDKDIATNTIIIVTGKHFLYHVGEKPGTAVRYGVGVGRAGHGALRGVRLRDGPSFRQGGARE